MRHTRKGHLRAREQRAKGLRTGPYCSVRCPGTCETVRMRVRRYFAFVDLCGFTRFTEVHGDVESVAVLTGFRALVRDIASEHGVRVAKWLGDGAMFVST